MSHDLPLTTYDYIIVGQGLAGSMLAYFLLQQNKKILVIDQFHPSSASNIAAGVVNPITGRKMVKTWKIDDVLPFAKSTYRHLEKQLRISFFYEQPIYKLFTSSEDIDIWNRKKADAGYAQYLGDIIEVEDKNILAPFGAGVIQQACWMDVPFFIQAYRKLLKNMNCLLEEELDIQQLNVSESVTYKNRKARKIIFCEGYKAYRNPYFNFIPFSTAKGEHLIIYAPDLNINKIYSRNIFIIPKGNQLYNIGSTFLWNDLEETVTDESRNDIQSKLKKMTVASYTIMEEKAGIRPTVKDRRPVLGAHPNHQSVYIFNGLGTKGVSLAPYFANYLTGHLDNNHVILSEISVNRFFV